MGARKENMNKKNICFVGNNTGGAMAVLKRKHPKTWRALGAAQQAKARAFCALREQAPATRAEWRKRAREIRKQFQLAISRI
jgi:hypothetical protein